MLGRRVAFVAAFACGVSPAQAGPAATWGPIPDAVWADMQGKSWRPGLGCPGREALVLLKVPYRDFAGQARTGSLVLAARVAPQAAAIFTQLFERGFRISRMEPIDRYGGDDDASMAANNTSAFNCRFVEGTARLSAHSLGLAVDINPIQNPYVRNAETAPPAGRAFDTSAKRREAQARGEPGLIVPGGSATKAFAAQGWVWGGTWRNEKDYQHFAPGPGARLAAPPAGTRPVDRSGSPPGTGAGSGRL